MKCSVCGKRFDIKKENTYTVDMTIDNVFSALTKQAVYDAIDCPKCGCQQLLKERKPTCKQDGVK